MTPAFRWVAMRAIFNHEDDVCWFSWLTAKVEYHGWLSWLLFQYPFHPRVTAVASKRSRSFCQKCLLEVTTKHIYTLRKKLWIKWRCKLVHGCMVHTGCVQRWQHAVSRGTIHVTIKQLCKYNINGGSHHNFEIYSDILSRQMCSLLQQVYLYRDKRVVDYASPKIFSVPCI